MQTVTYFRDFIGAACEQARGQRGGIQIPPWNRVTYSVPDIYKALIEAVEEDNVKQRWTAPQSVASMTIKHLT